MKQKRIIPALPHQALLEKYALADLALARKHGSMAIANTKYGLLEIRYDRAWGRMSYSILADFEIQLMFVSRKKAMEFVADSYVVTSK
jgi:hypothetical protein